MPVELASELISGPDLGGGWLCQLTRERDPLPEGFTFHLQEAGTDAGAPPTGSPARIGYRHPEAACMYGGRGCWHRRFELPRSELLSIRTAYNRTRFVLGPMLAQASGQSLAPFERGLTDLLDRVVPAFAENGTAWWLAGEAAARLQGAPLSPSELDVLCEEPGPKRLADLFGEYLIEPNHPILDAPGRSGIEGAAFLGTLLAGIRVRWTSLPRPRRGSVLEQVLRANPSPTLVAVGPHRVPVAPAEVLLLLAAAEDRSELFRTVLAGPLPGRWDPDRLLRGLGELGTADEYRQSIEHRVRGGTRSTTASSA